MESIRLRNIRSLADTGPIELKPITLLLGQNSSGKSTVLRTLPLLLQSVRTRSNAPILWYGDLVDFGSVREVKSTFAGDDPVQIEISLGKIDISRRAFAYDDPVGEYGFYVSVSLDLIEVEGKTRLRSFRLQINDDHIYAEIDSKGGITILDVNGFDFSKMLPSDKFRLTTTDIVPQLITVGRTQIQHRPGYYYNYGRLIEPCEKEIRKFWTENLPRRISEETITALVRKVPYKSGGAFSNTLLDAASPLVSARNLVNTLIENGGKVIDRLRSLYLLGNIVDILTAVDRAMTRAFNNVSYVGPSRATGERYYRMQELAVDQIDPQGRNLAMFLHSLTPTQQGQFSDWLLEAVGYALQIEKSAGHIQIHLREEKSTKFYNIADMGYGFSQVLPIMAQVWSRQTRAAVSRNLPVLVAMEQPELHLHPAYQAKLAQVFARSVSARQRKSPGIAKDIRFLIETHSESLINELGNLVYKKKVSANDIAIYVFEKGADSEITKIRDVRFEEDGTLNNWPIGFFSARS